MVGGENVGLSFATRCSDSFLEGGGIMSGVPFCVDRLGFRAFGSSQTTRFPSGVLNASVAKGLTSPPYVKDETLLISAVLVSHEGDGLDEKTPHLRSVEPSSGKAFVCWDSWATRGLRKC